MVPKLLLKVAALRHFQIALFTTRVRVITILSTLPNLQDFFRGVSALSLGVYFYFTRNQRDCLNLSSLTKDTEDFQETSEKIVEKLWKKIPLGILLKWFLNTQVIGL